MRLKCLGSGSSGNCYLLENGTECLVIEAGILFREVKKALDFNIRKIKAVVISHEHGDHAKFISEYERAGIPVFKPYSNASPMTLLNCKFLIRAFDLVHDVPCYGFYIRHPEIGSLVYASDTEYIKWRFKDVKHILVEANYCKDFLDEVEEGNVKRNHVLTGHMEIQTTVDFLKANNSSSLQNVVLLHLSMYNADAEMFRCEASKVVDCPVWIAQKGLELPLL